jgi:hypothetical protein
MNDKYCIIQCYHLVISVMNDEDHESPHVSASSIPSSMWWTSLLIAVQSFLFGLAVTLADSQLYHSIIDHAVLAS